METKKHERLDEEALSQVADGNVDVPIPRNGHPLPEGIVNPEPGQMGHMCIDPKTGIYRKDWYCLKLQKTDGMPTRQHFNICGKTYNVLVGVWVDVPPQIMDALQLAEHQEIKHGYDITDALGESRMTEIVDSKPRFSYVAHPSA